MKKTFFRIIKIIIGLFGCLMILFGIIQLFFFLRERYPSVSIPGTRIEVMVDSSEPVLLRRCDVIPFRLSLLDWYKINKNPEMYCYAFVDCTISNDTIQSVWKWRCTCLSIERGQSDFGVYYQHSPLCIGSDFLNPGDNYPIRIPIIVQKNEHTIDEVQKYLESVSLEIRCVKYNSTGLFCK